MHIHHKVFSATSMVGGEGGGGGGGGGGGEEKNEAEEAEKEEQEGESVSRKWGAGCVLDQRACA